MESAIIATEILYSKNETSNDSVTHSVSDEYSHSSTMENSTSDGQDTENRNPIIGTNETQNPTSKDSVTTGK